MSVIEEIIRLTRARPSGDGYVGRCPSHDDSAPSLSFRESGGRLLLKCFKGCSFESIREALKAQGVDLRAERDPGWETVWRIYGLDRQVVAQHHRIDPGKVIFWRGPNGEKAKLSELGVRLSELPPYAWERVTEGDLVFVTEGEKSADALMSLGLVAVGTFGAEVQPGPAALAFLRDHAVVLWPDNDEPGRKHMALIAATLAGLGIKPKLVAWPEAPPKGDAADFVAKGLGLDDIERLLTAPPIGFAAVFAGMREAMREAMRFEAQDYADRMQTGIRGLDRKLRGGLRRGEVTLLGAPTGGGKSTLVQQIAATVARKAAVLFVSPEMRLVELAEREMIRRSGKPLWDRNPWTSSAAQRDVARNAHAIAAEQIEAEKLPLYIFDRVEITMLDVEEAAARIDGLGLVVIDYAQQIAGPGDSRRPRYLEVGDVGTRSIILAQSLNVPVLLASQVNSIKVGNSDRREFAFRETAILEHKAHTVLILDVSWNDGTEFRTVKSAEIVCTKQRSGATFRLPVLYEPALYRITDPEAEPDETPAEAEQKEGDLWWN